jgi:hypothetical protein
MQSKSQVLRQQCERDYCELVMHREALASTEIVVPRIPVVSNVDAQPHSDPEVIKDILARQVCLIITSSCQQWVLSKLQMTLQAQNQPVFVFASLGIYLIAVPYLLSSHCVTSCCSRR